MSITVVGSVAYDTVTTLFGKSERQLGGSAIYFSLAASMKMIGEKGKISEVNRVVEIIMYDNYY